MEIAPAVLASHGGVVGGATSASDDALKSSDSATPSSEKENSNNYNVSSKYDDDDEEGDVCRICRNPGDVDNPLRYPCACSGSIKFVHQDCLLQWLNHSNARQCEVQFLSLSLLFVDTVFLCLCGNLCMILEQY